MDITKLPKWAQQEIANWKKEAEHWRGEATRGPENSNTFILGGLGPDEDTPLGTGPVVRFFPGSSRDWFDAVEVRVANGQVRVNGGEMLAFFPHTSNTIIVKPGRR